MMKTNKLDIKNFICIASVGKPRGLKGEFFLNSFCYPKDNILEYSKFYIQDNKIPDFEIEYIKKINSKFCAKVKNINDIENIKNLTNLNIYIDKQELPILKNKEAYWFELTNMEVIDKDSGDILGIVSSLNNYGAQDCLEVKPTDNSVDKLKRLIPYIKDEFIESIERDKNIIYVNWDKTF